MSNKKYMIGITDKVENLKAVIKSCKLVVSSLTDAWKIAYLLIGEDKVVEFDYDKSKRAGYNIYSNGDGTITISDLKTRLEINFEDGTSKNIWILGGAVK